MSTDIKIMMCSPDYFEVKKAINPHMNLDKKPDIIVSHQSWSALNHTFQNFDEELDITRVLPQPNMPDMCFAANEALVVGNTAIMSKFRHEIRRPEIDWYAKAFEKLKYHVIRLDTGYLPDGEFFEGCGDALRWGNDWLILGYGIWKEDPQDPRTWHRSTKYALEQVAKISGLEPIFLELVDPHYYHTDTAWCPIGEHFLYYPNAFSKDSRNRLMNSQFSFAVTKKDAENFICNSVYLQKGDKKVLIAPANPSESTRTFLKHLEIEITVVNLKQFMLSGGAARCLTLFI